MLPMAAAEASETPLVYHKIDNMPLLGTLAPDASVPYSRLPDSLESVVRKPVWELGQNSAGLAIRFRSNTGNISARWKSASTGYMTHMSATGSRGVDLYVLGDDSVWTTLGAARPDKRDVHSTCDIMRNMEPRMREYMLYLSLYNGVDSIEMGIDSAAVLLPPAVDLPRRGKPVVMYGSSILQGGCATRPGMAHTNILMRDLQHEVINLGFSGNGLLDPEIARLMAQADASLFVVDAMPNCSPQQVEQRMDTFIDILREAHPSTPILLIENPLYPQMRFNTRVRDMILDKNKCLRKIYERRHTTDNKLYYFRGENVLAGNNEATVDNTHFTDTGFATYASNLKPIIELLIK